jgi:hypothetical protein
LYSNVLSTIFVVISAGVTLFLVIFYSKNLEKINDPLFIEKVGGGIEGSNRKKTFEKYSIVINLVFFFGRRIVFIASVIFLDKFLWA